MFRNLGKPSLSNQEYVFEEFILCRDHENAKFLADSQNDFYSSVQPQQCVFACGVVLRVVGKGMR